jgi:hypothetical protein
MKARRKKTTRPKRCKRATGRAGGSSAANLKEQLDQRTRERDEALRREKATAEVLRVISSSRGALEPVFKAILINAVHICEAKFGVLYLFDGKVLHVGADFGISQEYAEFQRQRGPFYPAPGTNLDRDCGRKRSATTLMPLLKLLLDQ